jgi:hypothetical protein
MLSNTAFHPSLQVEWGSGAPKVYLGCVRRGNPASGRLAKAVAGGSDKDTTAGLPGKTLDRDVRPGNANHIKSIGFAADAG